MPFFHYYIFREALSAVDIAVQLDCVAAASALVQAVDVLGDEGGDVPGALQGGYQRWGDVNG